MQGGQEGTKESRVKKSAKPEANKLRPTKTNIQTLVGKLTQNHQGQGNSLGMNY